MTENARKLYEEFKQEYISQGYMHSGCIDYDILRQDAFNELLQLGLIQIRECAALAYELTKSERVKLVKDYDLELKWITKGARFMVNDTFEELLDLKQLTESEMRERIKEIDAERAKLREEKEGYENYFAEKRRKQEAESHKNYIGKCFVRVNKNHYDYVQAFKILEILDSPNEKYASCLAIINGYNNNCWPVYGIQKLTMGLWTDNAATMISYESSAKVIDFFKEITLEEFDRQYTECVNTLDDMRDNHYVDKRNEFNLKKNI